MTFTRSLALVAASVFLTAACATSSAHADAPNRRRVHTTTNAKPPAPLDQTQPDEPVTSTTSGAGLGELTNLEPKPIYLNFINGAGAVLERNLAESTPLVAGRVVLFTEPNLGFYPKFWNGRWIHGGTPIEAHLESHLAQVRRDVARLIPNPNWDGFAVIDYESWGVTLKPGAQGEYKERALGIARSLHPGASEHELDRIARTMWNQASIRFMLATIDLCKEMRPDAKWGFFGYPKIGFGPLEEDKRVALVSPQQPLLDHSDALYPEAYARRVTIDNNKGTYEYAPAGFYENHLVRLMRWSRRLAGPDKPILPYVTLRYNGRTDRIKSQPLTDRDLETMLSVPIREGADGLILWAATGSPGNANHAQTQTRDRVAPLVERLGLTDRSVATEPDSQNGAPTATKGRRSRRASAGQ